MSASSPSSPPSWVWPFRLLFSNPAWLACWRLLLKSLTRLMVTGSSPGARLVRRSRVPPLVVPPNSSVR